MNKKLHYNKLELKKFTFHNEKYMTNKKKFQNYIREHKIVIEIKQQYR